MPTITDNNGNMEAEEEDMDQLENDDRKSSEEEFASGSGEGDEDQEPEEEDEDEGGSSDMDEDECDRRKNECMDDLHELSQQFCKLKDQLFHERQQQIDLKLSELQRETEPEYLMRLDILEKNKSHRLEVADVQLRLRMESIESKLVSEEMASRQHMNSERELLHDQIKNDLEEKIKRLEEDRHNLDITSDLYDSQNLKKKKKLGPFNSDRRKKPVVVSGPYIVYSLLEDEIIKDWSEIKRGMKQQTQRRKVEL